MLIKLLTLVWLSLIFKYKTNITQNLFATLLGNDSVIFSVLISLSNSCPIEITDNKDNLICLNA